MLPDRFMVPPPPPPGTSSTLRRGLARLGAWWRDPKRLLRPLLLPEDAPLDLSLVGRMLGHAVLVGLAAGLVGAGFFASLEWLQDVLLEGLAGYRILRAAGEHAPAGDLPVFRPWLLVLLPALGGLVCGLLCLYAPEARGGGSDAAIEAFHRHGGVVRRRVLWVKPLASLATLGTGGAGGREGPTMHLGAALGSMVGRVLGVGPRERRILLIAGVAAGIAAVFRTPLGAALIAVEVLYRDGFESDALVPSVLSSVVAYSVVISLFGEATLFSHAARFPFVIAHLPLYGVMALLLSLVAALFVACMAWTRARFERMPGPVWLRPAVGGLLLGIWVTAAVLLVAELIGGEAIGLGLAGGGYGAVQVAISDAAWLPEGWVGVALLAALAMGKVVAASLTISSGGSAGDFAPSLAIGGLLGGAFGRAVQLLLDDPSIDPGAFALVGMGTFYGGIAHVPLAALVLVCELAGTYDLLVPLMLSLALSFVALRKPSLYHAQVASPGQSPVHREALLVQALEAVPVGSVLTWRSAPACFALGASGPDMLRAVELHGAQDVFPVLDQDGLLVGLVRAASLRRLAIEGESALPLVAADLMQPPVSVRREEDLRRAAERLLAHGLRQLPVVDASGRPVGLLDEHAVARVALQGSGGLTGAVAGATPPGTPAP